MAFTYGIEIWVKLENFHWEVFDKSMEMHMMSHINVCSSTIHHILLVKFGDVSIELFVLK